MSTLQVVELHICMHRKTANIHMEKRSVMLTIMAIRLTFNIRLPCDKSLRRLNEIFFQCRSSQCGVCGHSQRAQSEAAALPEFSHHRCPDARNHTPRALPSLHWAPTPPGTHPPSPAAVRFRFQTLACLQVAPMSRVCAWISESYKMVIYSLVHDLFTKV